MRIVETIAEVRQFHAGLAAGEAMGFVPTMGALHAGHMALVEAARRANGQVAASIFVNPTQFGPNEDLAKYPRTFEADVRLLERSGVELLFAPTAGEMYPEGFATAIDVGPIGARLDGASRPGHFVGVATVVAKLFGIVQPTRAYFGQKDAAQVAVLRRMVRDLSLPVELVVCPTVREVDGLALSSRNRYLSAAERGEALALSRALRTAEAAFAGGVRAGDGLLEAARAVLRSVPGVRVDYLALVDPDTLEPLEFVDAGRVGLLAVAAWVGATRLIDNVLLG